MVGHLAQFQAKIGLTSFVLIEFAKATVGEKATIELVYEKFFHRREVPTRKRILAEGTCAAFRKAVYDTSKANKWPNAVSTAVFLEGKLHNHASKWKSLFVLEGTIDLSSDPAPSKHVGGCKQRQLPTPRDDDVGHLVTPHSLSNPEAP